MGDKRQVFGRVVVFVWRAATQPDVSPKQTLPGTQPPRVLWKQKVRCLCRSAATFLQAETATDPRQCFSSVYTKWDGVLNTGTAAPPGY